MYFRLFFFGFGYFTIITIFYFLFVKYYPNLMSKFFFIGVFCGLLKDSPKFILLLFRWLRKEKNELLSRFSLNLNNVITYLNYLIIPFSLMGSFIFLGYFFFRYYQKIYSIQQLYSILIGFLIILVINPFIIALFESFIKKAYKKIS